MSELTTEHGTSHRKGNERDCYCQALRGMAILAVIMIHTLPQTEWTIYMRPLLNWSVAMFLFLSGYFTKDETILDTNKYYKRRLAKILPPYLFWSILYIALSYRHQQMSIYDIIIKLLIGSAAPHLYFLIVYMQLVIITPVILRMNDKKKYKIMLYIISPVLIILRTVLETRGHRIEHVESICFFWLVFYMFGINCRGRLNQSNRRNAFIGVILVTLIIGLITQYIEAQCWYRVDNYVMAVSQLKITNVTTALSWILVLMVLNGVLRDYIANSTALKLLGDQSFGLYLCHVLFTRFIKQLPLYSSQVGAVVLCWALATASSLVFVIVIERLLPSKMGRLIGFV